jgi:hypothetical protein
LKEITVFLFVAMLLVACGNEQTKRTDIDGEQTDAVSVLFRDIDVKMKGNQLHLSGEAKSTENEIYYELTQGEEVLQQETAIPLNEGHLGWSEFDIELMLPKDAVEMEDTPIVMLYVKGNNSKVVNPNYIPVDINR